MNCIWLAETGQQLKSSQQRLARSLTSFGFWTAQGPPASLNCDMFKVMTLPFIYSFFRVFIYVKIWQGGHMKVQSVSLQ